MGEYWAPGELHLLLKYIDATEGCMSLFDSSLHRNLHEAWFKPHAYALILLRQGGYPCLFYPDLYGAHYVDKGRDGQDHEIWLEKCDGIEMLLTLPHTVPSGTILTILTALDGPAKVSTSIRTPAAPSSSPTAKRGTNIWK